MKGKTSRKPISDSDDYDDDSDAFQSPKKKSPRKSRHFSESSDDSDREESPSKRKSDVKANFFLEDLSSDDEVYTIQCPSNFNMETLSNVKVDFTEVTQITEKTGEMFNVRLLESQSKSISCALPSRRKEGALTVIPLVGHIVIQKDVSIPDINFIKDKDDKVDYPTDLKVRHPLLGADWENYVSEASEVLKKLGDDDDRKKKRHQDNHFSPKKKRKHE